MFSPFFYLITFYWEGKVVYFACKLLILLCYNHISEYHVISVNTMYYVLFYACVFLCECQRLKKKIPNPISVFLDYVS